MPETLTESFCERCGSRYTFESAAPKQRMRGMRVLSRGVKNFVLDDKTSFDEAMAAARSDTDRESTNAQLDAFHKTFNFCMECRQYTCPDCWNDAEGRCLGCAPLLAEAGPATASPFHTAGASPFHAATAAPTNGAANGNGTAGANGTGAAYGVAASNGHALVEPEAEFDPLARLAFLTAAAPAAEPEPVVAEPEPVAVELEPDIAAEPEPVVEAAVAETVAEPVAEVEVEVGPAVEAEPVVESIEPAVAVEAEPDPDAVAAAAIAAALIEPEWIVLAAPAEALVAEPEPVARGRRRGGAGRRRAGRSRPPPSRNPCSEVVAEAGPSRTSSPSPAVERRRRAGARARGRRRAEAPIAAPAPRIEIEPETMARPVVVTDPSDPTTEIAAVAAARTSVMFTSMRPGQSIDDAIAEYDQAAARA